MTEDQNKRYGRAVLDMLLGQCGGDLRQWKQGAEQMIAVQSERISALEKAFEDLANHQTPGV